MADILPHQVPSHQPSSSTSHRFKPSIKTRLPKLSSSPFAGPSVSSLYYSAYSSFAPCYDSTGSTQTSDHARVQYLSNQRIDRWARRPDRYFNHLLSEKNPSIVISSQDLPSAHDSTINKPVESTPESTRPTTRSRKRQKTNSSFATTTSHPSPQPTHTTTTTSTTNNEPPVASAPVEDPDTIHQQISSTLLETSRLIRNLQERQFDRLRLSQDVHLDPILSSSFKPHQSSAIIEPDFQEMAEAKLLMHRLASLIGRRPRPRSNSNQDHSEGSHSRFDRLIVPSRRSIRKAYDLFSHPLRVDPLITTPDLELRVDYPGRLSADNPIGVRESILTTEPNPQLVSLLDQSRALLPGASINTPSTPQITSNRTGHRSIPRFPGKPPTPGIPTTNGIQLQPCSTPLHYLNQLPSASKRDPLLMPNKPSRPIAQSPLAGPATRGDLSRYSPARNHHHLISKFVNLSSQSNSINPPPSSSSSSSSSPSLQTPSLLSSSAPAHLDRHHHPPNRVQVDQQRHLQHLQVQKLLLSYSSNGLKTPVATNVSPTKPNSTPPGSSLIPPISTPTLNIPTCSATTTSPSGHQTLLNLSSSKNSHHHPNYRALASSSSHPLT